MTGGLKPIGTRGPTGADGAAGPAPSGNAGDVVTLASSGVAQSSSPSATRTLLGLGDAALLAVGAGGVAAYTDAPASILTANGDLLVRAAGVPARVGVGSDTQVLTVVAGAPAWATPSSGATFGSGTLAARPASPAAGDTYAVTSGVAKDDVYVYLGGAWVLISYARTRQDDTPYHWWKLTDASGGAADSGSAGTALAEAGSGATTLYYQSPLPLGDSVRFTGGSGSKRFQGAVGAGVALTTAATLSAWIRADNVSGSREVVALETNQGSNAQPYFSIALTQINTTLRAYVTTTNAPGAGQSITVEGIIAGELQLVGMTFASSTVTVWIDGVAVGTLATSGGTLFTAGSSERWTISDAAGPGERFIGRIADVRVYQTAQSASWWRETYQRGAGSYLGQ